MTFSDRRSIPINLATTHIKYLEMTQQQLQQRLNQAEMETQRLRSYVLPPPLLVPLPYLISLPSPSRLNEALMLSTAERHGAVLAAAQQQGAF